MNNVSIAGPDVTLRMDLRGIIQQADLSNGMAHQDTAGWIGRAWTDTVADFGCDKVRQMLDDARTGGISAFRQITQRFPSGLELPMEYTAVRVGGRPASSRSARISKRLRNCSPD